MVQAVGLALFGSTAGISVFGVAVTTATGALTVAGAAINIGAGLLVNTALQQKPKFNIPRPDDIQRPRKSATGDRVQHVGRVMAGGNTVFDRGTDGIGYYVTVFGLGEIDGFERIDLDRTPVTIDENGVVTDDFLLKDDPRVSVFLRRGVVPEVHYGELTSIWPEWTPDHRLDGLASALVISRSVDPANQRGTFPFDEPEIQAVMRTLKCYDPRTGDTEFTENAALIIGQFTGMKNGLFRPDIFDEGDVAIEAAAAEELIPVVGGGAEERWRLAGSYSLSNAPSEVLKNMLASTGARIRRKLNGKFAFRFPRRETPVVTLTGEDILQVTSFRASPDLAQRYSKATAEYLDQSLNFTSATCNPVVMSSLVDRYGAEIKAEPTKLDFAPSNRQAQEALQAQMVWDNFEEEHLLVCRASGLEAVAEWAITIDAPEFGLAGTYYVAEPRISLQDGGLGAVTLKVLKIDETGLDPRSVADQGEAQTLPENSSESDGVPLPTNVSAVGSGIRAASGVYAAGIFVAFDPAPADSLTPLVEYRGASADVEPRTYTAVSVAADATGKHLSGLADGASYDVAVSFVATSGQRGPRVEVENVVAMAAADAPAEPTGLSVSDISGGFAEVTVTASASGTNRETIILRDGVEVHREVTLPGVTFKYIDNSGAGSFEWTARAENVSGVVSDADIGPVQQTIA